MPPIGLPALFVSAILASAPTGALVEGHLGVALCGANGDADCKGAEAGFAGGVWAAWRPLTWLSAGLAVDAATLPAEGSDTGNYQLVGAGVDAHTPPGFIGSVPIELHLGGVVGWNRGAGPGDTRTGFGAFSGRGGLRWWATRLGDAAHLGVGFEYALTRPSYSDDEVCSGGTCAAVAFALVHRATVALAVGFW
jgi:hypothetical protein